MILLKYVTPPKVASVTLTPLKDSLNFIATREGGDGFGDDEIMERFVTPYFDLAGSTTVVKKDSIVTSRTAMGRILTLL